MKIHAIKTELNSILRFRKLYLQACNFQIRYNACHERNWSDSYLIFFDGKEIGYGAVKGKDELHERDAIFEFYILPSYQHLSSTIFSELVKTTEVSYIECQSNDLLLSSMMYEFAKSISSKIILFEAGHKTQLSLQDVIFRKRKTEDIGWKNGEMGDFVVEKNGELVASGGFLLHYNIPFADLNMEVNPNYRKQGFGSFIVQEIKKECYLAGRIPAARCLISNAASKATLQKAGMKVSGYMLLGKIVRR